MQSPDTDLSSSLPDDLSMQSPETEGRLTPDLEDKMSDDEDPAGQMRTTFSTIWKNATEEESKTISAIWHEIVKGAAIKNWSMVNASYFRLELEKPAHGKHPQAPGTIVIPQMLDIEFSEKDGAKTISFPKDKIQGIEKLGLLGKVELGSCSKIQVIENQAIVTAHVRIIGQKSVSFSTTEALNQWAKVKWS